MLTRDEYRSLDAMAIAGLVRAGEVTALETVEACISEIERLDPALNAVVIRNFEKARLDATRVAGKELLAGVPFLAKDINIEVSGFPTTHACRYFAGSAATRADSLLVRRWRRAGLVIAGRTNTSEFATDFVCEPELYGPTRNPRDLSRTPGGSSGGAAAAVASGMVPAAHASDSGGSIRVPAACCGVFGYKPTSGLVATGAGCGPLVGGLNCDHAITWTVRDSAAILDAAAGPEIGLPAIRTDCEGPFFAELENPLADSGSAIAPSPLRPGSRSGNTGQTRSGATTAGLPWARAGGLELATLPGSRRGCVVVLGGRACRRHRAPFGRIGAGAPECGARSPGSVESGLRAECAICRRRSRAGEHSPGFRSRWPRPWKGSTCC